MGLFTASQFLKDITIDMYSTQYCTTGSLLFTALYRNRTYRLNNPYILHIISILSTRSYWTDLLEVHWYVEWEKYGVDDWQLLSWSVTTRGRLDVLTRSHRLQLPLLFARNAFQDNDFTYRSLKKSFIYQNQYIDDTNLYYLVHNLNQHLGY